jgi:hypothetical protein
LIPEKPMNRLLLTTVLLLGAITGAHAQLKSETEAFLLGAKIDPKSPRVAAVAADVVVLDKEHPVYPDKVDLNWLAGRKLAKGAERFIAMRNFIRDFRRDPKTDLPGGDLYDAAFLSVEEKKVAAAAIERRRQENMRKLEQAFEREFGKKRK